jgi:hypothetical protein
MRRILIAATFSLFVFPLLFLQKVLASSLQITGLGATDVSELDLGGSLKSYTYSGGTFELTGLASPSASILISIDDLVQPATADAEGGWTSLISALAEGNYQLYLESEDEVLDFVLTVGEATGATESEEATISSAENALPEAGSTTTTILFLALAMLSIGLGFTLQAKQF